MNYNQLFRTDLIFCIIVTNTIISTFALRIRDIWGYVTRKICSCFHETALDASAVYICTNDGTFCVLVQKNKLAWVPPTEKTEFTLTQKISMKLGAFSVPKLSHARKCLCCLCGDLGVTTTCLSNSISACRDGDYISKSDSPLGDSIEESTQSRRKSAFSNTTRRSKPSLFERPPVCLPFGFN